MKLKRKTLFGKISLGMIILLTIILFNAYSGLAKTPNRSKLTCPSNISYEYHPDDKIPFQFTFSDEGSGGNRYTIYKDGAVIKTGNWTSPETVHLTIEKLAIGVYNYTTVISDKVGNTNHCTFFVQINLPSQENSQIFPTVSSRNTSWEILGLFSGILFLFLIAGLRRKDKI